MSPKTARLSLSLLLLSAAGCTTYSERLFVGSDDYELARVDAPDGARETYLLENGRTLRVRSSRTEERPDLGFEVVELDKARAERRGVRPYQGLLVVGAREASSAREAGVRADDVLLAVGDAEVVYVEQLAAAERGLREQQDVTCRLLRGDQEIELTLTPQVLVEDVTEAEGVALERAPASERPYAGVTLRGIPTAWCERIFGDSRNAVVISEVEVGSPAWLAGFRGGDLIEQVDGEPVPPVDELARRIQARGPAGQSMTWQVRREQGQSYEATFALEDYSGTTRVHFPILFSSANSAYEDRWKIGWGLIMGNRNTYVADRSTRRVQTRNRFSALLGLIKVDSLPDETRVRLLWFIRFDT